MATSPGHPRLPAGERLRHAGIAAWSIIGILILAAISFWLLLRVRVILPPLALALLIIYLLNPLVSWLHSKGIPRALGAIGTYVVVLGGVTLLIISLIPFISRQVEEFADEWPEFRAGIAAFVQDTADSIDDRFGLEINTTQVSCLLGADEVSAPDSPSPARCDEVTKQFREQLTAQAGRITEIGFTVLESLLVFILAPLMALYLLIDLPQLQRDFLNLVPETHRQEFADLGSKIGSTVGGFFRGQLLVALLVGILASIGFWIIDLPFWLVIGAIAGVTNLIPLVGPFIGGGLGLIVGSVTEGFGLGFQAVIVALVVQQIDNHFVSPLVMKRTVQLHPATVVLALLAGGTLAGFWGILLGVPAVAVAKLLLGHLWQTRVLGAQATPYAGAAHGEAAPSAVPDAFPPSSGEDQ